MPTLRCPVCGAISWFKEIASQRLSTHRSQLARRHGLRIAALSMAFMCANEECGAVISAVADGDKNVFDWWPKEIPDRPKFPDVPDHIAEAAGEAHYVNSLGAHRAAGALARAVIEATAKDQKITKGRLADKIEEMAKQELIRPYLAKAAHEVRHFGNDIAHGDFVDPVDPEEAADILDLMDEVLAEVYQSPTKIEKVEARRKAREEQQKQQKQEREPAAPTGSSATG